MKLVLTRVAARQLGDILAYIREHHPNGARRVQPRLRSVMTMLLDFPEAGAPTDEPGTRRIVVTPYPYAVFYQIRGEDLIVERIRHTARKPV